MADGIPDNFPDRIRQFSCLISGKSVAPAGGMDPRAIQRLASVDVSQARYLLLIQQKRFYLLSALEDLGPQPVLPETSA